MNKSGKSRLLVSKNKSSSHSNTYNHVNISKHDYVWRLGPQSVKKKTEVE